MIATNIGRKKIN